MATLPANASRGETASVNKVVAPLRPGIGHSFFWRRLHSLTGIAPIGAFLIEHILFSNAVAINGPTAYARQVRTLASLPLVTTLEAIFIWLPLLYHGFYGFYIWYRGRANAVQYPWEGNWMYSLQRWTGAVVFFYIGWHVWSLRFTGVDIHQLPGAAFGKVQMQLAHFWMGIFYTAGLWCAAWHFSYGIWLFCAKWGITAGERARQKLLYACICLFLLISIVGMLSLRSFAINPQQPVSGAAAEAVETGNVR